MDKANYVDGFVLVIPKDKISDYEKMAQKGAKIWKKYGALDYKECVGDDLSPDMGEFKIRKFPDMVGLKDNEVVVFSFITFKSRSHRDEVNSKVMQDPEMNDPEFKDKPMPFDPAKMAYGGFKILVNGT